MEIRHTGRHRIRKICTAGALLLVAALALTGCSSPQTTAVTQPAADTPDAPADQTNDPVAVVVSEQAHPLERTARQELIRFLSKLYPDVRFTSASEVPSGGRAILIGTPESLPSSSGWAKGNRLRQDSFAVQAVRQEGQQLGIVAGADPQAALHGVYALLEDLGYGFYLSYTASPAPRGVFSFDGWDLTGAPLTGRRFALNWHNFLSSAAAWDLPDWKHYTRQLARMRYTGLMVHAYGNNPMVAYTHNGQAKPVGYLATTARGRDWGTQHVNDVRRLHGTDGLFERPVFGAQAALVPPAQRTDAARALMQQVFAFAETHGLDVTFALDVDTKSSNPQNIIRALPQKARFETAEGYWLANPDTPTGYAFYKTQAQALLKAYPQIDHVVAWFRHLSSSMPTPWRKLTASELPAAWQDEYETAMARHPDLEEDDESPSLFAISKTVRALRQAFDEMGHEDVEMGVGTWGFEHLKAADLLLPEGMTLMGLDYELNFETSAVRDKMQAVSDQRSVYPILWAHHDDGTYLGRSYTPFTNFATLLDRYEAAGFGIIHWTTRPHDLYFKSLSQQVWSTTKNRPLEQTARQMAARTFGSELEEKMGTYLTNWATEAPQFGQETTDRFLHREASSIAEKSTSYLFGEKTDQGFAQRPKLIARTQERQDLLQSVNPTRLDTLGRWQLAYYSGLEQFYQNFYRVESAYRKSARQLEQGDLQHAHKALREAKPAPVIEQYAQTVRRGGISRGEEALIISLNLRWRPFILSQHQRAGLRPIRINFQPTRHEPLAQGPGSGTFYVDPRQRLWLGLGKEEIGAPTYRQKPEAASAASSSPETTMQEVARSGIASEGPFQIELKTIAGEALTPGTYQVELVMPSAGGDTGAPKRIFEIALQGSQEAAAVTDRVELTAPTTEESATQESADSSHISVARRTYTARVGEEGRLILDVTPIRGQAMLSGVILKPQDLDAPNPAG